ncbi:unnamed protein product [Caenorhabditis angaria]|uniref:Uncharacterized protein n=1 Tax=Caenorhabditis angaria TaxID=860376 RepID=A0A9P1N399_9PELO|nr:unnamed protein product [Caenorhabditis angaria]
MVIKKRNEVNCFNPRDYQVELLDKACKRNIIVQLGTGSGKTFIAVLLLKEFGVQIYTPLEDGGKRAFFIVEKVNLVEQQAVHIERHTKFKVGRVHGQMNCEISQNKESCDKFIKDHHVIVITAQCLLDLINHAFIQLKIACVLIFDECHHSLGSKHPYRLIMSAYKELKQKDGTAARVLGLTASLIKEKTPPAQLEEKLNKLEAIMECSIETASDLVSLSKFGAKPYEVVAICQNFDIRNLNCRQMVERIIGIFDNVRQFIDTTSEINPDLDLDPRRPIRDSIKTTLAVLRQLGPWAAWKLSQIWYRELNKLMKTQMLPEKAKLFLNLAKTAMETVKRILEPEMKNIKSLNQLKPFIPHRLIRLLETLEMFSPEFQEKRMRLEKPEHLSAIVFVDQRYVACALQMLIRQIRNWEPAFSFLKSDYVVGASGNNLVSNDNQGLHKRQTEVLRKFHKNDINVLIATSVLEEGVDVKQCNVVVKFDRPSDMRSYVQSKGRARKPGARYLIFVEEADSDQCNNDLRDFKLIEKLLLNRYRTVHNPVDDEIGLNLENIDELVSPYIVESTGAIVRLSNAIQLVNRYCGKLPSDIFTRLVPHNKIIPITEDGVTKYCAELLLPINSPIKNAIKLVKPMPNKKSAQMAVALEACRQLHQKGELDDNLLPKGRESIAKLLEHIDDEPDEYAPGISAKVGSAKRKQLYDKKVARSLHECLIEPNKTCYIYVLDLERVREPELYTNPKRRKFVDPNQYEYCFGFLSSRKIPKVPPFPVYLRQGDMRVRLILSDTEIIVNNQDFEQIKLFHDYLFTQVLQLCKSDNLMFDTSTNTPINTLIVPLNKNPKATAGGIYSINMKYVSQVVANMRKMPRVPDEETRKQYKFNPDDYKDAIVMPWYRNVERPAFYYVAELLPEMSPSSQFPDDHYTTFNEYFIKKYDIQIYDQNQSLLDVDYTSHRLNLLLPRHQRSNRRSTTSEACESQESVISPASSPAPGEKPSHNTQRQIFVPELMDIHPISATLWNVIAALPSVFYRLNQLLLTDELRQTILINAFGKDKATVEVTDNLEWPPLSYPSTYEEKQSVVVSKLQQLKELNKKTQSKENNETEDDGKFKIGVWDPEDAIRCGLDVSLPNNDTNRMNYDGDDDTIGLMSGLHDGNISDEDEADLGPFVMHDYKQRLTSQLQLQPSDELWAPREGIVASGWGDLDDDGDVDEHSSRFEIIADGQTTGFDLKSLMEDVGRHVNVAPTVAPEIIKSEKEIEEELKKRERIKLLVKAQEKLETLDVSDARECNRKPEEIIDLDEFDDNEEVENRKQMSADDEIKELMNGEELKNRQDAEMKKIDCGNRNMSNVLVKLETQPTFSFKKESPTMHGLRANISDISHLDNEIGYGVSPCLLLTALTTSNASDGMSLERFETIGDSFLKFAVTDFLYHKHEEQHEGKLSFARSKEVSNCNLYRLGKKLGIPQLIIASKFDAQDSWLPPCYVTTVDFKAPNTDDAEERDIEMEKILEGQVVEQKVEKPTGWDEGGEVSKTTSDGIETITFPKQKGAVNEDISPLPYNLLTQQNISDKSIADAMEALIGVHLLTLGPNPTLKVMSWMGLKVVANTSNVDEQIERDPLLRFIDTPTDKNASIRALDNIWQQFQFVQLEEKIRYRFKNRAYLVQAFTHASYINNRVTGCYQRLEFLGDAVLDYMITRYLFEDVRQYSPGVLTDLRSALVNNTIFASLAVKFDFQKHFIAMCPGLHHMIEKFVKLCSERNFDTNFNAEMYMVTTEEEIDEGQEEDIEVPKAMGDIFESLAGSIYLDCGRNLDVTWTVIFGLMKTTIEECCANPPRSPIRELMEWESSKARFSKMERILETGKVRVTVDVGNNMRFTGMGRNYRIAKSTAAKRALKYLHAVENQRKTSEA